MKRQSVVIGAAAVLLLAPLALRARLGHPLAALPDSYRQLLAASHPQSAYTALLHALGGSPPGLLLNVLLGLASLVLLDRLLHKKTAAQRAIIIGVVAANPLFLTLCTTLNPLPLATVLVLGGVLAFQRQRGGAGIALVILASLFAPSIGLAGSAYLLVRSPRALRRAARAAALSALACAFLVPTGPGLTVQSFVEFGHASGLSLFYILLAVVEASVVWKQQRAEGVFLAVLIGLSILTPAARSVLGLVSSLLAGELLAQLAERQWELDLARRAARLLIACTFLFLIITHLRVLAHASPSQDLTAALSALPDDDGRILTPPDYEVFVRAFSRHEPVVLPAKEAEELYRMYRLAPVAETLRTYNISYLLLPRAMREGYVWNHDDEGLLRVLKTDRFSLVTRTPEEEIWRFRLNAAAQSDRRA